MNEGLWLRAPDIVLTSLLRASVGSAARLLWDAGTFDADADLQHQLTHTVLQNYGALPAAIALVRDAVAGLQMQTSPVDLGGISFSKVGDVWTFAVTPNEEDPDISEDFRVAGRLICSLAGSLDEVAEIVADRGLAGLISGPPASLVAGNNAWIGMVDAIPPEHHCALVQTLTTIAAGIGIARLR